MNSINLPAIQHWPVAEPPSLRWLPDLVRLLRRRVLGISATASAVMALVVIYLVAATPVYTAEVQLVLNLDHSDAFQQTPVNAVNAQGESAAVDSELQIISSDGIARLVVRKLHLSGDAEFMSFGHTLFGSMLWSVVNLFSTSSGPDNPQAQESRAIQTLTRITEVKRIGISNVITVDVHTPNPERSADLANAIASAYLEEQLDAKLVAAGRAGEWLSNGIAHVRDDALTADHAVQSFKEQSHIVDTDKGLMNEQRLADLNADLTLAHNRTAEARARANAADEALHAGIGAASVSDAILNPVIVKLRQQYFDDVTRDTLLSKKYGTLHFAVVRLREEIAALQAAGQDELHRIAEGYHNDLTVALASEAAVQGDYDRLVAQTAETNKQRVMLRDLMSSADIYRTLYQNFLQRYTQAVQDQTFPIPQARVFTSATPPLEKSSPKTMLLLGLGGIAALTLGVGAGFILETFDRGLRSPSQVKAAMGLDCIALLPRVTELPGERRRRQRALASGVAAVAAPSEARVISTAPTAMRIVKFHPFSGFAEALHAVMARLTYQQRRSSRATVTCCVSALPGEGKTTVASNLAQLLAESGSRTIVLDWDLRKRELSRQLAPNCKRGFAELVAGTASFDDVVYTDKDNGLEMLPTAEPRDEKHVSSMLTSKQAASLLNTLRQQYDHIVVDLPALAPVADTQLVAHLMDTVLVVVQWGETDRELVNELLLRGQFESDRILGVVLNMVDSNTLQRYAATKSVRSIAVNSLQSLFAST